MQFFWFVVHFKKLFSFKFYDLSTHVLALKVPLATLHKKSTLGFQVCSLSSRMKLVHFPANISITSDGEKHFVELHIIVFNVDNLHIGILLSHYVSLVGC